MPEWTVKDQYGTELIRVTVLGEDRVKIDPIALRSPSSPVGATASGTQILLDLAALRSFRLILGVAIGAAQPAPARPVQQPVDPEKVAKAFREHGLGHLLGPDGLPTDE